MTRNYVFAPDEYYHVYARGLEKIPVYREVTDYERFMEGLYLLNTTAPRVSIRNTKLNIIRGLTSDNLFGIERGETLVSIGAYCLMPNHFLLLVREKDNEGRGISKFMQKLMTSYTMYFNKKNDRTGALFGSSFKARHVTEDTHLKYLFAYIHMNPRELSEVINLESYRYSSYPDYLGNSRVEASILEKDAFPGYFDAHSMKKEVEEWLTYESEESQLSKV